MNQNRTAIANKTRRAHFHYGYVIVAAGFMIWLVGWGSNATFGIFFKSIAEEFGISRAHTAGAYGLMAVIMGFVGLVAGTLTDKIGPNRVVPIFGSFLGLGYILMAVMTSAWQFDMIYGLGMGIGLSIVNIPVMTTVSRWFSGNKGLMMGVVQAGLGVGGLIIPPLTAWLILTYDWRRASLILGIITLVSFIISGLLLRRDPPGIDEMQDRSSDAASNTKLTLSAMRRSLVSILGGKIFWILFVLVFCFGLGRTLIMVHIAPRVTDVGLSLNAAANVLAVLTVASIFGRIGLGRLADVLGNRFAFIISFACNGLILIWVIYAESLWSFMIFALFFGFSWGGLAVFRFGIVVEKYGNRALGSTMGLVSLGEMIGSVFGSVFGGYLFDITGDYRTSFLMGAVTSLIGMYVAWKHL